MKRTLSSDEAQQAITKFSSTEKSQSTEQERTKLHNDAQAFERDGCYDKALEVYQNLENEGDLYACYKRGQILFHGPVSLEMGKEMFRCIYKATGQTDQGTQVSPGYPPAWGMLAKLYFLGAGCEKDFVKAKQCCEEAIKYPESQGLGYTLLALLYDEGRGVDRNDGLAELNYRLAIDAGEKDAYFYFATYRIKQGGTANFGEAQKLLVSGAKLGCPAAQYLLGRLQLNGIGVDQDVEQGKQWLIQSAKGGYAHAATELANYCLGNMEYIDAVAYLHEAVRLGDESCCYQLGKLYQEGKHVPKDEQAARLYFKVAADRGVAHAAYEYAEMCKLGQGGDQDLPTAMTYYIKAADGNVGEAVKFLEDVCDRTKEPQSLEDAINILKAEADKHNSPTVNYLLANFYFNDKAGDSKDLAFKYCKAGADGGHIRCMFFCAQICWERIESTEEIEGGEVSEQEASLNNRLTEALGYYAKAEYGGHLPAKEFLEQLLDPSKKKSTSAVSDVSKPVLKVLTSLTDKADSCSPTLCFLLGDYYHAKGLPDTDISAAKYFKMGANRGHAEAAYCYASMCRHDVGVVYHDLRIATAYFTLAGILGYDNAWRELDSMSRANPSMVKVAVGMDPCRKALIAAVDKGSSLAISLLGKLAHLELNENRSQPDQKAWAAKCLKSVADGGRTQAMFLYAGMIEDTVLAIEYYERAFKNGVADAGFKIAMLLAKSSDTEQEAPSYLSRAANAGSHLARVYLAKIFLEGCDRTLFPNVTWTTIFDYLSQVKKDADPEIAGEAYYLLGKLYMREDCGYGNSQLAFECYRESVKLNYWKAHTPLGLAYLLGNGVEKSSIEAMNCFKRAAGEGDPKGWENFAKWCKNPVEARDIIMQVEELKWPQWHGSTTEEKKLTQCICECIKTDTNLKSLEFDLEYLDHFDDLVPALRANNTLLSFHFNRPLLDEESQELFLTVFDKDSESALLVVTMGGEPRDVDDMKRLEEQVFNDPGQGEKSIHVSVVIDEKEYEDPEDVPEDKASCQKFTEEIEERIRMKRSRLQELIPIQRISFDLAIAPLADVPYEVFKTIGRYVTY